MGLLFGAIGELLCFRRSDTLIDNWFIASFCVIVDSHLLDPEGLGTEYLHDEARHQDTRNSLSPF